MITADYHVHSDFSSDSITPMEHMIERAIELGLKKLCFTDHLDYDYPIESDLRFVFDLDAYFKNLAELKDRYKNKLQILTGVELGLQPHLGEKLNDIINNYNFDFVIGSSHVIDNVDPYYPAYWESRTVAQGINDYFQSIIDNCKAFQGFHIYGHLDYIIRYIPGQKEHKIDYSYSDYVDVLEEALKTIISYGMGIELNTAGLKYGLDYAHPKPELLRRYKELGGELITVGSDGHKPEHLAYDFHVVPDLLKSCGFNYYTTFEQGKPVFEKL